MPKDFITLADWSAEELLALLDRARELKQLDRAGERPRTLEGRALAMFFEKPSLRTHVTFEAGMAQLGGHAILPAARWRKERWWCFATRLRSSKEISPARLRAFRRR